MKKTLGVILSAALLAGCSTSAPAEPTATAEASATAEATQETVSTKRLSILAPQGVPAISLVPVLKGDTADVTTVDGADALQAAFVNPNPEYDVIIAPTNLGVKLAQAGNTTYRLLAVVSWGNLYLVGTSEDALETAATMALFGEQAVPGLVFNKLYPEVSQETTWYASTAEASAALLAGNADVAMIAEPAASAAIGKAKADGKDLYVVADLQEQWGGDGYPQASLFVREEDYQANIDAYSDLLEQMAKYNNAVVGQEGTTVEEDVDAIGVDVLGVPSGAIVAKSYDRLGIQIQDAASVVDQLDAFLSLFGISNVQDVIVQ